jgi:tetratricopeptide (TPR) repeat protein
VQEIDVDRLHQQVLCLTRQERYADALALCERAMKNLAPCFLHDVWHCKAHVLWTYGRNDEALDAISHAISLDPENRPHRFARARWATAEGKLHLAEEDWTELVRLEEQLQSDAFLRSALAARALTRMLMRNEDLALQDLRRLRGDEEIVIGDRLWSVPAIRRLSISRLS